MVKHLDEVGLGDSSATGPKSDMKSNVGVHYVIVAPHDVYNEEEFLQAHSCDMQAVGLEPNMDIVNEQGIQESVLVVRNEKPRQLLAMSKVGQLLQIDRLAQVVREGQAEDQFTYEVAEDQKACAYSKKNSKKMLGTAALQDIVAKHIAKLVEDENRSSAEEDEDNSEDIEAGAPRTSFFRRGGPGLAASSAKRKSQKHKLALSSSKTHKPIKHIPVDGKQVGAPSGASQRGPNVALASALRSRFSSAASVAGQTEPARGDAGISAPSLPGAVADSGGEWNFDFLKIIEGKGDRTLLNGVIWEIPTIFLLGGVGVKDPGVF